MSELRAEAVGICGTNLIEEDTPETTNSTPRLSAVSPNITPPRFYGEERGNNNIEKATQYGVQLAVHLISSHFGNLVAKVCDCLLRKGTLTLASVIRFTELPPQQVKSCILVLIQHNCVQAFAIQQEVGFGEAPRVVTQYMALFHNILHRMRFAKFLAIVSEELDKECEEILEGLLQHGRLTLEQILDRAKSNQSEGKSLLYI
ncbi:DNA-directed RNA polymerase III subunit rpc3-like [Vitis riparia]|uniref:DNA-directed RNA polymerase III subunit rpc3-like n=1 Tax=Vitis riparia TaxID=96939 RepID=UPI00155AB90B|nr:DNA-directed RNA polymerase III subunit rpc3-like [Vitis riparia]